MERALREKINTELKPLLKAIMEWEHRILHSANVYYLNRGDATADYHQPTLPLPLLKQEVIHSKKQFLPGIREEELGGYEPITMEQWKIPCTTPQSTEMAPQLVLQIPRYNQ